MWQVGIHTLIVKAQSCVAIVSRCGLGPYDLPCPDGLSLLKPSRDGCTVWVAVGAALI